VSAGRYLYALVPAGQGPQRLRAGRVALTAAPAGAGLRVLYGAPPEGEGLAALRAHDAVVRALHGRFLALLPFRFDTRVEDERALARALKGRVGALRAALKQVRGREQMALRLLGPPEAVSGGRGNARSGAAFLRERAARARVPELDGLREAVRPFVQVERCARPEQGSLRACVYHLVERGAGPAYLRAVRAAPFEHPTFRLVVSGPEPAWAFGPEVER
jgi:hypothetical protein